MIEHRIKVNLACLLVVFLLLGFYSSCDKIANLESQPETIQLENGKVIVKANDSNLSNEDQDNLQNIAEKLAVRYVYKQDPDQTEVPDQVVDFFYNGLVHLYDSNLDEVKEIRENHVLIAKSPANPREILIWTNQTEPWLVNWRAGETRTGVSEIDELIDRFNLTLEAYREYSVTKPDAMAKLHSNRPVNVYALGDLFAKLPEIEKAGPDRLLTGGRDIQADIKRDYLLLDITVGSGDCPSGCINRINYQFQIFANGSVELAG